MKQLHSIGLGLVVSIAIFFVWYFDLLNPPRIATTCGGSESNGFTYFTFVDHDNSLSQFHAIYHFRAPDNASEVVSANLSGPGNPGKCVVNQFGLGAGRTDVICPLNLKTEGKYDWNLTFKVLIDGKPIEDTGIFHWEEFYACSNPQKNNQEY